MWTDLLPASSGEEITRGFLQELVNILFTYICKSSQRSSKVLNCFHQQYWQYTMGLLSLYQYISVIVSNNNVLVLSTIKSDLYIFTVYFGSTIYWPYWLSDQILSIFLIIGISVFFFLSDWDKTVGFSSCQRQYIM